MHDDVETLIEKHNEDERRGPGRIVLPNERLAILWIHELLGQLSDGAWENHWHDKADSWEDYHALKIEVDSDINKPTIIDSGITGELPDFLNRDQLIDDDLVDIIGDRMVKYVSSHDNPDYDEDDLRRDLLLLNDAEIK